MSNEWNTPPDLTGPHARLEPLAAHHVDALARAVEDGELWRCWFTSVPRPAAMALYIEDALAMQAKSEALVFAIRAASGEIVGCTRMYDLDPGTPRAHIGYTWLCRSAQRTAVNTEAKRLLLGYAFDQLGCVSVGFRTSWFNHPSRAAIERLGAKQDGVLRAHTRHRDGSLRDTVCYSIVASEWPVVKKHLEEKLGSTDLQR